LPQLDGRTYAVVAWVGIAVLGASIPALAALGQWVGALVMLPFLAVSVAFVLFEPRLPTLFDALFAWAAVINAAGYAWDLYDAVNPYDGFVHLCTIFAATLTFGYLTFDAVRGAFRDYPALFVVMIASFGLAAGALWEVFEWAAGFIGSIADTMVDLMLDGLGALAAALLATHARDFVPRAEAAPDPGTTSKSPTR
jgi:hypothetical protein